MKKSFLSLFFSLYYIISFAQQLQHKWDNIYINQEANPARVYLHDMDLFDDSLLAIIGGYSGTLDFNPEDEIVDIHPQRGIGDIVIQKLHKSSGEVIWTKTLGGSAADEGYNIKFDKDGNLYCSGYFSGSIDLDPGVNSSVVSARSNKDNFLLKLDADGNFIWGVSLGSKMSSHIVDIAVDSEGSVYAGGRFEGSGLFLTGEILEILPDNRGENYDNGFVVKLNPTGSLEWAYNLSPNTNDPSSTYVSAIDVTSNDEIVVYGNASDGHDLDPGPTVLNLDPSEYSTEIFRFSFLQKVSKEGKYINAMLLPLSNAMGMTLDKDDNVIITGKIHHLFTVDIIPGAEELLIDKYTGEGIILKLDKDWNFHWVNHGRFVALYNLNTDKKGSIYISAGTAGGFYLYKNKTAVPNASSLPDVGDNLLKFKPDGCLEYYKSIESKDRFNDIGGVVLDDSLNIYMAGYFYNYINVNPNSNTPSKIKTCTPGDFGQFVVSWEQKALEPDTNYYYTCEGDSILSPYNTYYKAEGTYNDTLVAYYGCDSIIVSIIDHSQGYLTEHYIDECNTYTLPDNGIVLKDSIAEYVYTSSLGCDSTIRYIIDIKYPKLFQNIVSCDSLLSPEDDSYIKSSGTYQFKIEKPNSCLQYIEATITILQTTYAQIDTTVCETYTSPSGKTYTVQKVVSDTISNEQGCDSIISIDLKIDHLNKNVILRNDSLIALQDNASYLWIDCTTDETIDTETMQGFKPAITGKYKVLITYLDCTEESACTDFITSIREQKQLDTLVLYPNPSSGYVELQNPNNIPVEKISITDAQGRVVFINHNAPKSINLSDLNKGYYIVHIQSGTAFKSLKLVIY